MKIIFTQFAGEAPKISPRLLPDNMGTKVMDCRLASGELRPFHNDLHIADLPLDTQSIYKYKVNNSQEIWLSWNRPVNVVKGPVFADEANKIYLTGVDDYYRVTDSSLLNLTSTTVDATNSYIAGIPGQEESPLMEVSGTATDETFESRSYVFSYVRVWPDEQIDVGKTSKPAQTAASRAVIDVKPGQQVKLSKMKPLADAAKYGVNEIFVYRTAVTTAGDVSYFYVDRFKTDGTNTNTNAVLASDGTWTYTDKVLASALGEAAPGLYFDTPKPGCKGLVSVGNGVFAMFKDTEVFFSELYQPHAWPYEYHVTVDYPIVGLGAFGNTLVICTTAMPLLVTVTDPASPLTRPLQDSIPCMSKESIVNFSSGTVYATHNGLTHISSSQPTNITASIITREEWKYPDPTRIHAAQLNGSYYGFYSSHVEDDIGGFIFDIYDAEKGIVYLSNSIHSVWSDEEEGMLYMVVKTPSTCSLVRFDSNMESNRAYRWKSKQYVSPEGLFSLSAAQVHADYSGWVPPVEPYVEGTKGVLGRFEVAEFEVDGPTVDIDDQMLQEIGDEGAIFKYYVDGVLKYVRTIYTNNPFRIPAGFRGTTVEVEVLSRRNIHFIAVASSINELA